MRQGTLFLALTVPLVFYSCKKENETILGPPKVINLITNSSFEFNDTASLQGWDVYGHYIWPVKDAPPGGGMWSVAILSEGLPVDHIRFTVAVSPGTHVYKFSVWAKVVNPDTQICSGGSVFFYIKRSGTLYIGKDIGITDTTWTLYSAFDTLTTSVTESLLVNLAGGPCVPSRAGSTKRDQYAGPGDWEYTYFDLCKLEVLH